MPDWFDWLLGSGIQMAILLGVLASIVRGLVDYYQRRPGQGNREMPVPRREPGPGLPRPGNRRGTGNDRPTAPSPARPAPRAGGPGGPWGDLWGDLLGQLEELLHERDVVVRRDEPGRTAPSDPEPAEVPGAAGRQDPGDGDYAGAGTGTARPAPSRSRVQPPAGRPPVRAERVPPGVPAGHRWEGAPGCEGLSGAEGAAMAQGYAEGDGGLEGTAGWEGMAGAEGLASREGPWGGEGGAGRAGAPGREGVPAWEGTASGEGAGTAAAVGPAGTAMVPGLTTVAPASDLLPPAAVAALDTPQARRAALRSAWLWMEVLGRPRALHPWTPEPPARRRP